MLNIRLSSITTLNGYILVELDKTTDETTTSAGLVLLSGSQEEKGIITGTVISSAHGGAYNEHYNINVPSLFGYGDKVIISKYSGTDVTIDSTTKARFVKETEVIGKYDHTS